MSIFRRLGTARISDPRSPLPATLRVGAFYLLLGILWIVTTDRALEAWIGDPAQIAALQTAKGAAFVVLSAILVALLVHRELRGRIDSENRIRVLAEQDLAGISVIGGDLRFEYVNRRFADMFGYRPDQLVGSSIVVGDLIAPGDRDTVAENLRRRLEGEVDDVRYRYAGLGRDGETIEVDVHGRRIEWDGAPAVMSLHLDVTREEQLREQARRSQRMESLGELTGAVAHDFNNLLTTIMAPLDLCEEHLEEGHPAREELEVARESADRARTLTRQLLSFSRRRMYQPRSTDLNEFVRRVHPMLQRLIDAGVQLRMDLADDLPPVEIDRPHFEQVLLNLVTNANEAVDGEGVIRIRTGVRRGSGPPDVVLEVIDDGRGMDEEIRDRVFEPFYTTRESGTGLGLATVHGIVAQAGGEISVDSGPGEGATFRIRLPASEEEPEPPEDEPVPLREPREATEGAATILVVDDDRAVRQVAVRALERHGFRTLSASDGGRALAVVEEHGCRIALALIDVGLPGMNGVEVAGRLKEIHPVIRVVYMSGHSDEEVVDRLARERSAGFLEKPFSVEQLLGRIHAALSRRHSGTAAGAGT